MMKKLLLFVLSAALGFGQVANDLILTQRKSDNSGNIQRNVSPTANAALGVNASKVPVALTAFTQDSATGAVGVTAQGTNQNVTVAPSGTGGTVLGTYLQVPNQSAPATPTTAGRLYWDSSNRLSWIGTNGFTRTFDGTANTANRIYTLPDFAGTVGLFGASTQTGAFYATTFNGLNGQAITGDINGAWTVAANGTNQNVTIAPSGTGAINLSATTGGVRLPSTNTAGLQLYNTADQVTDYERFSINWVANGATISSTAGGSGTARTINIQTASNQFFQKAAGSTSGSFQFAALTTSTAGQIHLLLSGGSTATSGTNIGLSITPTYNQSASTAANTDWLINRTETAVGSGAQYLIQAQVGSADRFLVDAGSTRALPSGATIAGTTLTLPATTFTFTGTNTATAFQRNYFGAPTFTDASAGTITDAFNSVFVAPAAAGGSLVVTRSHTLGVLDATSAASSITGGLVVASPFGTAATSVGIGGGNINAGGTITSGGAMTATGLLTASNAFTVTTGATSLKQTTIAGAAATTALTITQTPRTSGVLPYITWTIPTDTGQTASTESPGLKVTTGTRTWATTGTVALQRENYFAGPTYASASPSQTFTDVFTMYLDRPVAGTNAVFTRPHTFGVVDSTAATSSITGGVVVATTLGTAATSVGIGGGAVYAGAEIKSTSATAGVGYGTGSGGTVTQITSRTTGVTLNTVTGAITLVSAAGSATYNSFTVTNSAVAATDVVVVNQKSGTDKYIVMVTNVAAGSFQITFATTGGTTTEQPVFQFAVLKGSNN